MFRQLDDFITAGGIVSFLRNGGSGARLSTNVSTGAGSFVYLRPGDEICGECSALIDDEFRNASYANVLGRMKLRYGETFCRGCHDSRRNEGRLPTENGD